MAKDSTIPTKQQQQEETLKLYASIMEEIKLRISAIETGLGTARALLAPPLTSEFCFLQIRMICELIAISCLVAHGDVTTDGKGKRLLNEWNAEIIMTELSKLHPHFFPRSVKITATRAQGGKPGNVHLDERTGQLTKDEFLSLYGITGGALHRGTVNKLTGRKTAKPVGDPEILEWRNKLGSLLNDHLTSSWDNLRQLICIMKSLDHGGRVFAFLGEAPPGTSVEHAQSLFPKGK